VKKITFCFEAMYANRFLFHTKPRIIVLVFVISGNALCLWYQKEAKTRFAWGGIGDLGELNCPHC